MKKSKKTPILWVLTVFFGLSLLFARAIYPEILGFTLIAGIGLVVTLAMLIHGYRKALSGRSAAFGLQSAVTALLVIAIVCVLNFMASRFPQKLDLTKNKVHTLSDQTEKVVKGLKSEVKAVLYGNAQVKEQHRPLLENYSRLNPKFQVEYVNPDREPTRTKQAGIKKQGTLQLILGAKDNKLEEPTEEKLTNALIKIAKEKAQTFCHVTGHGEKNLDGQDAEGYSSVKKELQNQAYEVKEVNLLQEQKIPDVCDAIAILGPTKPLFEAEAKMLEEYLAKGGRAIVALDPNIQGGGAEYAPELTAVLAKWHVKADKSLIVDPVSRLLNMDFSVAIMATYNKESPITKDFEMSSPFPLSRPLDIVEGAPAGMNVLWLAKTTPKAWGETDFTQLKTGQAKNDAGVDRAAPLTGAIAVDGKLKDSAATRNTRLIVYGTSNFATNQFQRFGGNLDFFMNSASWVMEDESLISIRAKDETAGKVELSQKQGQLVLLITVIVAPLLIAIAGIVIWVRRRKL